jgi:hypothetical protein
MLRRACARWRSAESMRTLAFCRARRTSKGRLMSEAPEGGGFAVATCMTLDNVAAFLP